MTRVRHWIWYARIWLASRILGKQYMLYLAAAGEPKPGEFPMLKVDVPEEVIRRVS